MTEPDSDHLGKRATAPRRIPLRGWWGVTKRVAEQVSSDDVPVVAAGVAFFGFLSIFPAIAAFVILYGLIADPGMVMPQLEPIRDLVPAEVFDLIAAQLMQVSGTTDTTLGLGLVFTLALAVWSSAKGANALLSAMDIAYNETHRRGWIRPRITALAFTLSGLVFAMLAIGLLAAVPAAVALLAVRDIVSNVLLGARWVLLAGIVLVALGLLYRYGPNRRSARAVWITPGSILATVLWLAASWGFGRYVANVGTYNETFGALGAVVVLLMWLYISAYIVCIGAELNAELELHTNADTTTGRWRPKGSRGAYVADHTTPVPGSRD
jgi:membrane protein